MPLLLEGAFLLFSVTVSMRHSRLRANIYHVTNRTFKIEETMTHISLLVAKIDLSPWRPWHH